MSRLGRRRGTAGERRKSRLARQSAKQARRRGREPRTELDRLLDQPRGLENADPLMAEIAASAAISWWRDFADEGETREGFVRAVITGFGENATSNGLAMLHAMVPMIHPKPAAEARFAIDQIRARGFTDPPWAEIIGRPAFVEALAQRDEFGDSTLVSATFKYEGWPPHAFELVHDTNFGDLIIGARVRNDATSDPAGWSIPALGPVQPVEPQELAGLIERGFLGLEYPDFWPDAEIEEDTQALAGLLRARLRVLPEAQFERLPAVMTRLERKALVGEFLAAAWPDETPSVRLRSPRFRTARQVGGVLVDYGAESATADTLRCTPALLERFLIHEVPIELGPDADPDGTLETVRAWVRFTGERTARPEEKTDRLLTVVDELEPAFRQIIAIEVSAAESLARAMRRDGIDVTDKVAVADWLERFDRLPKRERDRILGPIRPLRAV